MPAKCRSVSILNLARVGEICRRATSAGCLLCAVFLAVLAGCSRSPTEIVIDNRSGTTLSNVWVSSEHFSQSAGTMVPGMSIRMTVPDPGKAQASLKFEAGGKKINVEGAQSFDMHSGHSLLLTVGTDLNVTASAATNGH
jgi:hypothetical protein